MNKESGFSEEYVVTNMTDSQSSTQEKSSAPKDNNEPHEIIKKIESDYNLSKPRRKIIHARNISRGYL